MCKAVIEDAPADHASRPFCSPRCKFADLDQWLSESYRISSPLGVSDLGDADISGGVSSLPPGKHR